MENKGT